MQDIQAAVRLVLPGELAKHAVSEGTKAVAKARIFPETVLTVLCYTPSRRGGIVLSCKVSHAHSWPLSSCQQHQPDF